MSAVELGSLFDVCDFGASFAKPDQKLLTDLGVGHLTAAEAHSDLDAVAFLSRTTFNSYIAPTPLERLEAGEGDAAVVARCELEKLAQQGFPAEHFRVVGDLQNLTNAVPGPGCFIRAPSSALRHM